MCDRKIIYIAVVALLSNTFWVLTVLTDLLINRNSFIIKVRFQKLFSVYI